MIIQADILEWAGQYEGDLFHALLCDPPYHLTEITDRFGRANSAPAQYGTDGAFQRASRGFMGKNWDGGDIAFRPETWATLAALLHPGAFGMAFASTRGFHRMAVAIEDAGLIIHPVIMCWAFGSGFPKATRLDTQIDRAAGESPVVIGQKKHVPKWAAAEMGYREKDNGYNSKARETFNLTEGATPLARAWQGHRYGMQSLKPALEPIIVFQKPYQGKPVESITRTGAGALNIDAGRVGETGGGWGGAASEGYGGGVAPAVWKRSNKPGQNGVFNASGGENEGHPGGRWPSNLVLAHHPDCNGSCVPSCPIRRLGEQSGELETGGYPAEGIQRSQNAVYGKPNETGPALFGASTGTAARFYFNADYLIERLENTDPLIYEAKASMAEREAGLEGFENGYINDGREAVSDRPYLRNQTGRRNIHPTVKPIAIARHLASLLLPPELYAPRRILIPFAGVASEMIGAMLAGWEDVVGVELEAEHIPIAEARLAYWQQRRREFANLARDITVKRSTDVPDGQLDMFGLD